MNPKEIVRQGYDKASYNYRSDIEDAQCEKYHKWLDKLLPLIPDGASVLDLGCGCGIPVSRKLATDYYVTGIDISPVQIDRARQLVPNGTFLCTDISIVEFPQSSFDTVVSFYTIFHLPIEEHSQLFRKIKEWLKPRGYLMVMVGRIRNEGEIVENWFNIPDLKMYFSHADIGTYKFLLTEIGFDIRGIEMVADVDDALPVILAQSKGI